MAYHFGQDQEGNMKVKRTEYKLWKPNKQMHLSRKTIDICLCFGIKEPADLMQITMGC